MKIEMSFFVSLCFNFVVSRVKNKPKHNSLKSLSAQYQISASDRCIPITVLMKPKNLVNENKKLSFMKKTNNVKTNKESLN